MQQRSAIITGGLGAIGTAVCQALAADGYRIGVLDHPAAESRREPWLAALQALGITAEVQLADLADYAAAGLAAKALQSSLGPVAVLVNAAGITRDARFAKLTPLQWREVLAANLDAAFNVCHALFAGMVERRFGRIVNLSSVNGQRGQFGQTNYAASKAGLHGFSMSLAQEGAAYDVTVNTVAPGYVATPMTSAMRPEVRAKIVAGVPVGRMAKPEEIARVVAFLAAPESGYITGACVPVNGGLYMSH